MLIALLVPVAALNALDPVTSALEPKFTLRPALKVMIPEYEYTVSLLPMIMSPAAVCDVNPIAPALVIVELI